MSIINYQPNGKFTVPITNIIWLSVIWFGSDPANQLIYIYGYVKEGCCVRSMVLNGKHTTEWFRDTTITNEEKEMLWDAIVEQAKLMQL